MSDSWTDLGEEATPGRGGTAGRAETTGPVDRSPSRFGTRVALAVAVVVAVGLGAAVWAAVETLVGVAGVLIALRGVRALGERGVGRRAAASLWLTLGTAVALAGLTAVQYSTLVAATVTTAGTAAVAVVGLTGTPLPDRDRGTPRFLQIALLSAFVLFCVGWLAYLDPLGRLVRFVAAGNASFAWTNTMAAFVILQVEALALAVALPPAREVVDRWLFGRARSASDHATGLSLRDVKLPYWVVLGVQAVLAVLVPDLVEWVLDQLSLLGTAIRVVLLGGVLHLLVAAVLAVVVFVFLARAAQLIVIDIAGDNPAETAAESTGPLAVTLVGGLGLAVTAAFAPAALTASAPGLDSSLDAVGPVALVAIAVAFGLVASYAVGFSVELYRESMPNAMAFAPAVAGALLLVAGVTASEAGVPALVLFAAVVGAVVVWDAGEFAVRLGRQVGAVETRRTELAHLAGTVIVGVLAVAVATAAAFSYGAIPSFGEGRASLALLLALVALLALLGLVGTTETGSSDDAGTDAD